MADQRDNKNRVKNVRLFELKFTGKPWEYILSSTTDLQWGGVREIVAIDKEGQATIRKLVDKAGRAIGFMVNADHVGDIKEALVFYYNQLLEKDEPPITLTIK